MNKETNYPSIDKKHLNNTNFLERNPIIPSTTFSNIMDLMFLKQGNHNIVDCLGLRVDVKEFQKDSLMIAKSLLELGIRKNDIIAVSMPNYYQAIPIFKAANMIGAVVTYLNPYASIEEIKNYLNLYESPILFNYNQSIEYNNEIKSSTKVRHIITMSKKNVVNRNFYEQTDSKIGNKNDFNLSEIGNVSNYHKGLIIPSLSGKNDALILYTSGSTGKAKGILFSNENLIASCIYLKNSTHVPKVTDDDRRWMGVVPFMYPYGFGASVLQTFLSGREVVLAHSINDYSRNVHLVFGSPAHLEVTKRTLPKDMLIPNLKLYLSGGDFLSVSQSKEAIKFFSEHGADVKISNSSGTGETLGCSTNAMNVPYRPETVGQLVVGPDYVILNEKTHKEVRYGEIGVLCTRGKHVCKGYYKRPDLTKEMKIMYNGKEYYNTGNIGYLDKDRYFTLIGRSSRFYITNTFNKVYCEKVQSAVSSIDIVDCCAIVPKPNEDSLWVSKAYVVLKEGIEKTNDVERYIIDKSREIFVDYEGEKTILTNYEVPASITFLDSLPRTELAEKIDYEKMKEMAKEEYENEKGLQKIKKL